MNRFVLLAGWLTSLAVLWSQPTLAADRCEAGPDQAVRVVYQTPDNPGERLIFWRYRGNIAWERPAAGIVELWQPMPNGRLALTRLFLQQQRGIAYEPVDLDMLGKKPDWQTISALATPESLGLSRDTGRKVTSVAGDHCWTEQGYADSAEATRLYWSPELALATRLEIKARHIHWQAQQVDTRQASVQSRFEQWRSYDLVDYADIGDMEADPFVSQLINMGFVEHSEHSAYYANGVPVKTSARHRH